MPTRKSSPPSVVKLNPSSPTATTVEIPIGQINPGKNSRRSWSSENLAQLQESIQAIGIQESILVRPIRGRAGKATYEIVDGFRRWTAASALKLPSMRAEVRDMTDGEVLQYSLMQKLFSEDLNPVDRTDAAFQLLAARLSLEPEEVVTLLNRASHQRKQRLAPEHPDNITRTAEWGEIVSFLKTLGITPEGFRTNWLPILQLPTAILECVRQGKIEYTKARLIARIKDAGQQQQILGEAIAQNLSNQQIVERIAEMTHDKAARSPEDKALIKRFTKANRNIVTILQDPRRRAKAEKLIQQLEELLEP
jgi:ParB family transcriptional regulator, chromosome partitioning protein